MGVNTKYKDSVFSSLFSDPGNLKELYSALGGVTLPPDIPIDINTLSGVLYMDQINDISFTIDNRLVVLLEHQSTLNPNMPLRLLIYIAHIYEKIIDRKKMYQTSLEKIPTPEFIVLYNGKKTYPDRNTLRLSDAFKDAASLKGVNLPQSLELVVQVYNINSGHNVELLQKSGTLGGYSFFIEKIREFEKTMPREEAMQSAIKYCIDNNILKSFLETQGSEVLNMLLTEWNIEEAKEVWWEEAKEEGREEGKEEGKMEIARNAFAEGATIEFIQKITGLNTETIQNIRSGT
jgi:predicted transposase/invertase (TIGR01784 family)